MKLKIFPGRLRGAVTPPPSKSQAHRALIAAALAEGESAVCNVAFSQDIEATLGCVAALGAKLRVEGSAVTVVGVGGRKDAGRAEYPRLDCGESGSTLRFLIPVALAVQGGGVFTGRGRLMQRPQKPYFDLFDQKGISCFQTSETLTVRGQLVPGEYPLPGDVSSQFITGLLYALPLLEGGSELTLTTKLESQEYVNMTIDMLKRFGVHILPFGNGFQIPGGQSYSACTIDVEADWSQAGFWYAAAVLGNQIEVAGMNPRSAQGDRIITRFCAQIQGAPLAGETNSSASAFSDSSPLSTSGECRVVRLDIADFPDLAPPLAAMGALMKGRLLLANAARLRLKESDRLAAIPAVLNAMGAQVQEKQDSLDIRGLERLRGGVTVDCHNDHRIAMMAAIATTRCQEPVTLDGAQCVAKSYPDFWTEYAALGGRIEEVSS